MERNDLLRTVFETLSINGYYLVGNDSNRYVNSDGWFELNISLWFQEERIMYVFTAYGDIDLENEYLSKIPCRLDFYEIEYYLKEDDAKYFLETLLSNDKLVNLFDNDMIDKIEDYINNN